MSEAADMLLTAVARDYVTNGATAQVQALASAVDDWPEVFERAGFHGMLPLLRKVLRDRSIPLPPEQESRLAEENRLAVAHSLLAYRDAAACVKSLDAHGVIPIVLKGPAVGLTLYEDPVLRPFSDLDLLITEQEWPRTRAALLALGAIAERQDYDTLPARLDDNETLDHMLSFRMPSGFRVEVTFDPLQLGLEARSRAAFRTSLRTFEVGDGVKARMPAPENQLLMLLVHLNRHGFRRLIWWVDVARMLGQVERAGIEWDSFVARALDEGAGAAVHAALSTVSGNLGVEVPVRVLAELKPGFARRRIWQHAWPDSQVLAFAGVHEGPLVFRRVRGSLSTGQYLRWTLANAVLTDRVPDKAASFARLFFPTREHLRLVQGSEGGSYAQQWMRRAARAGRRPREAEPSPDARPTGVSSRAMRGVAWNGVSRLTTRGIQFGVTLLLARLLAPADFGIAAMAGIVTMFGAMISDMGFGVAVVQKKELTRADESTAFWTSAVLGILVTAGCVAVAPLAAAAFRNDLVRPVVAWSSLSLLAGGFAVTPQALLLRALRFKDLAFADILSSVTYAVVAIVAALRGLGVWSIVIAGIALAVVRTTALFWSCRLRPRLIVNRQSLRDILPFGIRMFGTNIVTYARSNLDYFIVGATLGPASLGFYTLAFKLADFPRQKLASTITEVALPALSAVQDEEDKVISTYLKSLTGVCLITFPLLIGLAALTPQFITVAYGAKWQASIAPLQILLIMGLLLGITEAATTVIVARGHVGTHLRLSLWYLAGVAIFALAGVRWGIVGVALGVSAATALYSVLVHRALRRVVGIQRGAVLRSMSLPAGAAIVMLAALFGFRGLALWAGVETAIWLPLAVLIGAAAYGATVFKTVGFDRAREMYRSLRAKEDRSGDSLVETARV